MTVQAGEVFRFEQEVYFGGHLYGSTNNVYPNPGQIEIRRGLDGYYWDGSDFVVTPTWVNTTQSGTFHYYDFTIPVIAANGDTFIVRMRLFNDPHSETVGNLIVRPNTGGGGGSSVVATFDAVDFVTGFPSTIEPA